MSFWSLFNFFTCVYSDNLSFFFFFGSPYLVKFHVVLFSHITEKAVNGIYFTLDLSPDLYQDSWEFATWYLLWFLPQDYVNIQALFSHGAASIHFDLYSPLHLIWWHIMQVSEILLSLYRNSCRVSNSIFPYSIINLTHLFLLSLCKLWQYYFCERD